MTDKELRKLKRSELLEMLLIQTEENEALQKEVAELKAQLNDRRIVLENAGSIAEAALKLNGIFEAAENAAKQYLLSLDALVLRTAKTPVQDMEPMEKKEQQSEPTQENERAGACENEK